MDDELRRDQEWELDCVKKQKKRKSGSQDSEELPVSVQQEIEDLCYYVPEVTNHFNILDKIGEGTFSSVFLASLKHPSDIKEKFALKHIVPTSHPNRMIAELKCLQLFGGKENVMGVELCLKNRDHVVIIMHYFQHQKFLEYFNTLEVSEVRDYMKNLLMALKYIHRYDIIHRDVKPTNFLHNVETKKYALVDFGLAQDAPLKLRKENKDRPPIITFSKNGEKENSSGESPKKETKPGEKKTVTRTPLTSLPQRKMMSPRLKSNPDPSQSSQSASPRQSSRNKPLSPPPPPPSHSGAKPRVEKPEQNTTIKDAAADKQQEEKAAVKTGHVARARHRSGMVTKDVEKKNTEHSRPVGSSPHRAVKQQQVKVSVKPQESKKKKESVKHRVAKQDRQPMCRCYGRPSVCSFCTQRPVETAHRAGTPGFRAPEVLMRHPHQSTAVDIWSAGVIFLSLLSGRYPFFRGNDDLACLSQILSLLGTEEVKKAALSFDKLITARPETRPLDLKTLCQRLRSNPEEADKKLAGQPTKQWPDVPDDAVHLLKRMLDPNPATRIMAEEALASDFFA